MGRPRVARGPGERLRVRRIAGIAAERGADLVVGDTEPDRAGAPDGQARQFRLGVLEGGLPRGRVDRRDGSHQRVHEPVSHGQRWRGRATPRCARRPPGDAPRVRPPRRSGRWRIRAGPAGTGECRSAGSRAATDSAETVAPTPRVPPVERPSAHSEAVPRLGETDDQVEDTVEDDPAAPEGDGDAIVGPRHPARGEPRDQAGQVPGVESRASPRGWYAPPRAATRRGAPLRRLRRPASRRPRRPAGRRSPPCGRADAAACARGGTTRADRSRCRRDDAPRGTRAADVARGRGAARAHPAPRRRRRRHPRARPAIRRPGPGRSAVVRRRRRGAAPGPLHRCRDPPARHQSRRRPEQRAWCDEDHRSSVPTGCDTALP